VAIALLVVVAASGCTLSSTARNVVIAGTVSDPEGGPVAGLPIRWVVLKYRPGMPGTGEGGSTVTDDDGRYTIRIGRVHDAVSLTEPGPPFRCRLLMTDIPADEFRRSARVRRDFVCDPPTG
jgi:hypothetical protein